MLSYDERERENFADVIESLEMVRLSWIIKVCLKAFCF